jgi:curved DNA-binding protein CbpA
MNKIKESFRILDIKPDASPDEIRQAYKDQLWVWHPDRFPEGHRLQKKAVEQTKKINSAYEKAKAYIADRHQHRLNADTSSQFNANASACNRAASRYYSKPAKAQRPFRPNAPNHKTRGLSIGALAGWLGFLLIFHIRPKTSA